MRYGEDTTERGRMFNESQMEAIAHESGPAIVLAGPGTGKTTVITHRVKRLVEKGIAKSEEILVVTFTKAAAVEMQERYEKLVNDSYGMVTFGTFHSIFFQMLKKSGGNIIGDQVLEQKDKYRIIREIIVRCKVDCSDLNDFVEKVSDEISRVKGNSVDIKGEDEKGKEVQFFNGICEMGTFNKIYAEYEKALRIEKKIDFDDMIWKCNRMLADNDEVLRYWQNRYKFIMVDEFQDINRCQYENIKLIAGEEKNVFIVGDDDQSIYGFRGAGPELMFAFQREYNNVKVINLNVNYRCTSQIIDVADKLIEHNENRYKKKNMANKGQGASVDIRVFDDNIQQYEYMSKKILEYINDGVKPEEIAILVRSNENISLIRNYLFDRKISVKTKKKGNLYKHPVARDVVAYIEAANSDINVPIVENKAMTSILNKPERFVSRQYILGESVNLSELKMIYKNCSDILKNIKEFEMHLKMIKQLAPYAAVNYIRYGTGYDSYMREYANRSGVRYEDVIKMFNLVQQDASKYKDTSKWLERVNAEDVSVADNQKSNGIQVITMHASKGLEFPVVFIPDVNQGVIPGMRAVRECAVDEERRVFYVALTRASKCLHVYAPKYIMGRKMQLSQFINEMAHNL